jgi:ferredoxin-NADP reductase
MTLQLQVQAVESVTPRIKLFRLAAPGRTLPAFSPGSSLSLHVPAPVNRWNTYSLASDPADTGSYSIAVAKLPRETSRGGSVFLHENVRPGDVFEARLPANHFAPIRTARRHLLIAGGIGITPFLSYLPVLERWGADWELHLCHRGAEDLPFRNALATRAILHDSTAGPRLNAAALLARQSAGTHVYTCGPSALMTEVGEAARRLGWPEAHIHEERFRADVPPDVRPFTAHLARSGTTVAVAAGETLLEALERAGLSVPSSCRIGGCGTCEIAVCRGAIEHRDHCFSSDERASGRQLISCVSRAAGPELVLDL